MALLSVEQRREYFAFLGLGEYNEANILKFQTKAFSRKRDRDGKYGKDTDTALRHFYNVKKYTKNFKPEEFKCECNGRYCTGYPDYMKPVELQHIQKIRDIYGKPITVTCGLRCKGYNAECKGSITNSLHLTGYAIDFYQAGVTDTLANRKKSIKKIKTLPNHHYTYGNGINSNGASISAPYMGNALHTDTNPGATAPTSNPKNGKLIVDGFGGPATITALQTYLKMKIVDGCISGQKESLHKKYFSNITAVTFGGSGSTTVRAMQKWLGVQADGIWGEGTSMALQRKLGVSADGKFGPSSVKALQKFLNKELYPDPTPTPDPKPEPPKPKFTADTFVDVSDWQDVIDWAKVKESGIGGAIVRYADADVLDKKFTRNMQEVKKYGLHCGVYIYSRAKTKAEAERDAQRLYDAAHEYDPDMPYYIDLEQNGLEKYADTVAIAFLNKMAKLGVRGGVYANLNWWNNYLTKTAKDYSSNAFWIAQWGASKISHKNPSLFGLWQYSSAGSVPGVPSERVDMNKCFVKYWEKKPTPTPEPTPQPTPTPEPAKKHYTGTYPSMKLVKSTDEVISDAIKFGKWIPADKRFGYGRKGGAKYEDTKEYKITHSGGCHFCGTNAGKISKAKKAGLKNPEEWEYTYVCNTFVHACYAHAGVPSMLNAKNHSWWVSSYQKSKYWSEVKKPSKYTDLKAGDVLFTETHAMLYIGGGKIAEATSGGGDPSSSKSAWENSIKICNYSASRYKSVTNVFRLTGSVNSTTLIRYGEVSARVGLLQKYLIWYGALPKDSDDCIFGDATLNAVKKFQKEQGLTVDGIVGKDTLAKMAEVVK